MGADTTQQAKLPGFGAPALGSWLWGPAAGLDPRDGGIGNPPPIRVAVVGLWEGPRLPLEERPRACMGTGPRPGGRGGLAPPPLWSLPSFPCEHNPRGGGTLLSPSSWNEETFPYEPERAPCLRKLRRGELHLPLHRLLRILPRGEWGGRGGGCSGDVN